MKSFKTLIFATLIALSGLGSAPVPAQEPAAYSQAELDQMLAPIALYPDTVLSHILIAATYPLEVVEAARWSRNNPGYSGQDAVAMVEDQDWDPSVKALVAFPELLDRMDQDIAWTQSLGDAFLAQEGEVTDTIQYLRNQAYDNGHLQSNEQVNVVRETKYIYIEPAQPQVVYVPYYDPYVVYGHWRWADYPPVYWHHPPGFSLSLGFYWGVGFHLESSFFFSSFYWPSRHVVVVDHHYHDRYPRHGYGKGHRDYRPGYNIAHYNGANRWQHNSQHRRGVNYRSNVNPDRFSNRDNVRGRDRQGPDRTVRTRDFQRNWADQQRKQFVDNAAQNGGPRSRDSDAGRRLSPVGSTGDGGRAPTQRIAGRTAERAAAPRARQEIANRPVPSADVGQRVAERRDQNANRGRDSQWVAEKRDQKVTEPTRDAMPNREIREVAAASQRPDQSQRPLAALRRAEPNRQASIPRQAEPNRQVSIPRQAEPRRQAAAPPREVAAGRQASAPRQEAPGREASPQRQVEPRSQAAPPREVASARQGGPERAAQGQRSEPRQGGHKGERSGERSGQGRGSRKH